MSKQRVVIVGGGLAGLAAAMKLAEEEIHVDLISMVPVKRSHSVCAQGGINCVNKFTRAQGDSEWNHFDDSVYGGEFLNHQPPVKEMCDWAPRIVDLCDRLGVPFNRSPEGNLDVRRFGGTLYKRTIYAGASTGQQLLYALDEQVRRWETEGRIVKYEFWEFLGPILNEKGICRGCVAQDLFSMEVRAFPADAETRYGLSRCMTCGCCLEVCPQINEKSEFIGPQAIAQAVLFNLHPTGKMSAGPRLEALMQPGGITDCGNAQNCVKVCPKEVPLTWAIGQAGRDTTRYAIQRWLTK